MYNNCFVESILFGKVWFVFTNKGNAEMTKKILKIEHHD